MFPNEEKYFKSYRQMELYSLNGLIEILKPRSQREDFYDKCNWFITCLLKRTILDDKRRDLQLHSRKINLLQIIRIWKIKERGATRFI